MTDTLRLPARVAAVACCSGAICVAVFYFRLDHPAHLLGGIGLVAVLWALLAAFGLTGEAQLLAVVALVAAAAWVGEVTYFGPRIDASDALFTVMGSLLAAATLTGSRPDRRSAGVLAALGLALVLASLFMRYELQYPVSEWWYTV